MADGELPDIALLMRYGFAFGGRRNPVGVRIHHDSGCSVDVTGGGRGDMHRDDEQPHAEASPADAGWDPASLACLAPKVSQPSEWKREQCARMRRGLQSAWDAAWRVAACTGSRGGEPTLHVDPAWIELDEALHACNARGGGRSRGVEKGKPLPFLRD